MHCGRVTELNKYFEGCFECVTKIYQAEVDIAFKVVVEQMKPIMDAMSVVVDGRESKIKIPIMLCKLSTKGVGAIQKIWVTIADAP